MIFCRAVYRILFVTNMIIFYAHGDDYAKNILALTSVSLHQILKQILVLIDLGIIQFVVVHPPDEQTEVFP